MFPEWLLNSPSSTLFTIGLALIISLATTLLNKKFTDREQTMAWQSEIKRWNTDRNLARKTGDKKLLAKVKKQEPRILQMQSKMTSRQMKTSLITFVPLIIMWQVLIGFFQATPVARLPGIYIGELIEIPFMYWYIICSFFMSTLLSRIFGTAMGMGMGMEPSRTK